MPGLGAILIHGAWVGIFYKKEKKKKGCLRCFLKKREERTKAVTLNNSYFLRIK